MKILTIAAAFLIALPLAAERPLPTLKLQGEPREPRIIQASASDPSIGDWLSALTQVTEREQERPLQPNVATESEEPALIFPVVGSLPGKNGTYFRSEVFIVNYRPYPQQIAVLWTPAGVRNCENAATFIEVPANSWYFYSDFVQQVLKTTGIGAVLLVSVNSSRTDVDKNAVIDGYSRIWTPAPTGFQGSMSQAFPPVSLATHGGWSVAYGLRSDAQFRTNVGILNVKQFTRTFHVKLQGVNAQGQFSLSAPGCSFVSMAAPSGNYGPMAVYVWADDQGDEWYGYASSVDNYSGDNWSATLR